MSWKDSWNKKSGPTDTIIIQPIKSAWTGSIFNDGNLPVIIRCGCVLAVREVSDIMGNTNFVLCPICDFAYSVKSKARLLSENSELLPEHLPAQEKRIAFFQNEIAQLQEALDLLSGSEVELEGGEDEMPWLLPSDASSVDDTSGAETGDFLDFDSTPYALLQTRLKNLRARRDELQEMKEDRVKLGAKINAPWSLDPDWKPEVGSKTDLRIQQKRERRAVRRAARAERWEDKKKRGGAAKVVHNKQVLNSHVPRKWRDDDPNAPPPANYAEKLREKEGWLTEAEQEDLDEDEAEALAEKRRAEWRKNQPRVPQIHGSVQRQRWADRLSKLARRRHYLKEKLANITDERANSKWKVVLEKHEARAEATWAKCDARVQLLESRGRFELAQQLKDTLEEAEKIGTREIEAEIEAQRRAAEEAKRLEEMERQAREKAEAKAKAKADAEARGEKWVDPDAPDEGDEGEESSEEEN